MNLEFNFKILYSRYINLTHLDELFLKRSDEPKDVQK